MLAEKIGTEETLECIRLGKSFGYFNYQQTKDIAKINADFQP